MTVTEAGGQAGAASKRRLPIQIANEAKMIAATIDLLEVNPVDEITSRMIAERSGTATNYISRYFGGKDGLLVAVAGELSQRISDLVRSERSVLDLDQQGNYVTNIKAIPEISLWFKVYRYLTGRDLPPVRPHTGKPPLVVSIEEAITLFFGIEGRYVPICANIFITYIMGNAAFGTFLGTTDDEAQESLNAMATLVSIMVEQSRKDADV
ncbi:MAG: TetR/AcrR family transcriptional regulator [Acidimicrobiales bacterium]|jgi:AcrR family transcriptional regulator